MPASTKAVVPVSGSMPASTKAVVPVSGSMPAKGGCDGSGDVGGVVEGVEFGFGEVK